MASLLNLLTPLVNAASTAKTASLQGEEIGRERKRKTLLDELAVREKEADLQRQSLLDELTRAQTAKLTGQGGMTEPENYGVSLQEVVDPATGRRVLVQAGNRGTQKVAPYQPVPQPEPRAPQGSPVQMTRDGRPVFFNPVTGEVREPPPGIESAGSDRTTAATTGKIAEGLAQLDNIQQARAAVQSYPDAVGLKRGAALLPGMGKLGSVVNQYTDPRGINARRLLANVSSLEIKDRSGAAVTVSEFPRLAPFIPQEYDSPEKVLGDLDALERELKIVLDALSKGALLKDLAGGTPLAPPPAAAQPAARPDISPFLPPGRRP